MAPYMSSTSTTGERRKKVITYGKLSRLPPPRPSLPNDDAPTPERSHKHAVTSNEASAEPQVDGSSPRLSANADAATAGLDVFDVPSEDEFDFPPRTPAKRPIAQRSRPEGGSRASAVASTDTLSRRSAVTANNASQKHAIVKPAAAATKAKALQEQSNPQQATREKVLQNATISTSTKPQTKALRATENQKQAAADEQRLQRSNTLSENPSRATTPGLPTQSAQNLGPANNVSTARPNKPARSTAKSSASLDVFDVPSDGEDASLPIPKAPSQSSHQLSKAMARESGTVRVASLDKPQKAPLKSNELGSLHNRKRKGSATAVKPVVERMQNSAKAQLDRKVPKRSEGASPHHEPLKATASRPAPPALTGGATINKPKRTRTRIVPRVSQPGMAKGQSSPAVLHGMLPVEQTSMSLYKDTSAEVPASDDTMYDIPDAITTPVRLSLHRTPSSTPGSVTPRQKDLFSTLLGASAAPKTPASALASLQLSDKKPKSLLGALARSKSDISHVGQSRKARLIDTLKDKDSGSEEDDSESDYEADTTIVANAVVDADKTPLKAKHTFMVEKTQDELPMTDTTAADSQTSQLASGPATRPKLTYASQRSYLQEENSEDGFLMSMDLDDSWKLDSQIVSTDEEDAATSQPKTHRELRKYGQNTMFSWDMEESIREISDVSNRSGRRSAMMDLCSKMADAGFISQLLDSGFMHKLLKNMSSPGDVIFDFVSAVSILFVLQTKPAFAVVDQIYGSGVTTTLLTLLDKDNDISRIARDRKSNMSRIAQESLTEFRALVLGSQVWSSHVPERLSPQLLTLKTMDALAGSLRDSGSKNALLTPVDVTKLVSVCSVLSKRTETTKCSIEDLSALDLAISVLETVSITDQEFSTWPAKVLQQLSDAIPIFFKRDDLSKTIEAMKLCMHITNNKPKSCEPFSAPNFIGPLVQFIAARFDQLDDGQLDTQRRTQVMADLTLGLGLMINLTELNDQARLNAVDDADLTKTLVKTFQKGAERAAEANSVEESSVSVVIGFLAVLLGMMCLNSIARSQVRGLFPDGQLHPLFDIMKQFARINEHVDKNTASRFEGPEGQETLNNYYTRIMHVVRQLESATV